MKRDICDREIMKLNDTILEKCGSNGEIEGM